MDAEARSKLVLGLDGVILLFVLLAALAGSAFILAPAVVILIVIFFIERVLWFRSPRFSRKQWITIGSIVGAIVLLQILNSLGLAFPTEEGEKGRGLSFEFSGFDSPGAALGTITTILLLTAFLAGVWYGIWRPLKGKGPARLHTIYFVCLGAFVLIPALFLVYATWMNPPPDVAGLTDSEREQRLTAHADAELVVLKLVMALTGLAWVLAIALPHLGVWRPNLRLEERARPPSVPASMAAPTYQQVRR